MPRAAALPKAAAEAGRAGAGGQVLLPGLCLTRAFCPSAFPPVPGAVQGVVGPAEAAVPELL